MALQARYTHTNLIAQTGTRWPIFTSACLAAFPCRPNAISAAPSWKREPGVPGAHLRGMHLRLPGFGGTGPTLEVFNYNTLEDRPATAVNRPGFGHIAFAVDDVPAAREAVLAAGGRAVGEVVTTSIATGAKLTWCYVADPEGNVIELQAWS